MVILHANTLTVANTHARPVEESAKIDSSSRYHLHLNFDDFIGICHFDLFILMYLNWDENS